MTKTEYLTGEKPEKYRHLLEPLAKQRIEDMTAMLKRLSKIGGEVHKKNTKGYKAIEKRYLEIEKGIIWWKDLLEEGKN